MSSATIAISGASFTYTGFPIPAVRNVNLRVDAGECVVLCGESGCGKTTVTRLVNGLAGGFYEGEREGSVSIGGKDVSGLEEWELASLVGSVFQNPRTQFVNLDTTGEMAFGMENLGIPRDQMHAQLASIVKELGIAELMDRGVLDLSGGQMQAVAFASVRACNPLAYVLDEPSSNLDPPAMTRLASFIGNVKANGSAVLVAEHRLAYLSGVADRYVLMEGGTVAAEWSASEFRTLSDAERANLGLRSSCPPFIDALISTLRRGESPFPAAEARGICASYERGAPVLEDATVGFDAGSITGLVGPNGAGKSTLLKCLAGIKKEEFGHVRYGGRVVFPKKRHEHAFLVMQDPDYQLFRPTVRAELAGLSRDGAGRAAAEEVLASFGLADVAERHPASLSGGQKQRCVCAMASMSGAEALLLDEPTSGLDFRNMERLASILRAEAMRGKAVVVVSHDTEFLSLICDRIVLIE